MRKQLNQIMYFYQIKNEQKICGSVYSKRGTVSTLYLFRSYNRSKLFLWVHGFSTTLNGFWCTKETPSWT